MAKTSTEANRKVLAKRKAEGCRRLPVLLQPATVAALRELRARGAVSDAAAVNAAVVAYAQTAATLAGTNAALFAVAHEEAAR